MGGPGRPRAHVGGRSRVHAPRSPCRRGHPGAAARQRPLPGAGRRPGRRSAGGGALRPATAATAAPALPHAEGAWLALFGGPSYLLAATLANWSVPGWLAIGAIAAFVGGFMMLVLNLGEDRDHDSDPDDGAVV